MRTNLILFGTFIFLCIVGCENIRIATFRGYPYVSQQMTEEAEYLEANFVGNQTIQNYYALEDNGTSEAELRRLRDRIVYARIRVINRYYDIFDSQLHQENTFFSTATTAIAQGLNLATLLSPSSLAKMFAAISGGSTAVVSEFETNMFLTETLNVIRMKMLVNRRKILQQIYEGLEQNCTVYPLNKALIDLNALGTAGTFHGALESIFAEAGKDLIDMESITGPTTNSTNTSNSTGGNGAGGAERPNAGAGQ